MKVPREVLDGKSYPAAKGYGMPHLGARYTRDDVDAHRVDEGAMCACCGRPATDAHHCPPKSMGRSMLLRTRFGMFVLKPALIALCRECHMAVHAKRIRIEWDWGSEADELRWFDGQLLSHGYPAHSERLRERGGWRIEEW